MRLAEVLVPYKSNFIEAMHTVDGKDDRYYELSNLLNYAVVAPTYYHTS